MTLWECLECTTAFAVGVPTCPHCGSADYREQGTPKPALVDEPVEDSEAVRHATDEEQ